MLKIFEIRDIKIIPHSKFKYEIMRSSCVFKCKTIVVQKVRSRKLSLTRISQIKIYNVDRTYVKIYIILKIPSIEIRNIS